MYKKDKKGFVRKYLSGFFRAAVIAILVAIQFTLVFALSMWLSQVGVFLYYVVQVAGVFVIIVLVNKRSSISFKLAWLLTIALLPIAGLLMYILWGGDLSSMRIRNRILKKIGHGLQYMDCDSEVLADFESCNPERARLGRYMVSNHFPMTKDNSVTYYPMGEDVFKAIVKDFEKAEKFIFISFFIVGEGILWERIHDILKRKASEGVRICFMYDDFGSMFRTQKGFADMLREEGIDVRVFNPIQKYVSKLYMNYRNHQKIVVIDGNVAYTGGMNLADEYINEVERFGVWKDNGVRIEGEGAWGLTTTFLEMWDSCGADDDFTDYNEYRPTASFKANDTFVQIISDGPADKRNNPVESTFRQFINEARDVLYITTPYLVIEESMTAALVEAAKSGVDVRIITPFIPDKKMVKRVTEYHYGALLEAGVKVYEYLPGFIHAKTLVTDRCAIVGSINMDYRSFYLHYECGAFIWDADTAETIKLDFLETLKECHEVTYDEWLHRPLRIKFIQSILVLFSTLM